MDVYIRFATITPVQRCLKIVKEGPVADRYLGMRAIEEKADFIAFEDRHLKELRSFR